MSPNRCRKDKKRIGTKQNGFHWLRCCISRREAIVHVHHVSLLRRPGLRPTAVVPDQHSQAEEKGPGSFRLVCFTAKRPFVPHQSPSVLVTNTNQSSTIYTKSSALKLRCWSLGSVHLLCVITYGEMTTVNKFSCIGKVFHDQPKGVQMFPPSPKASIPATQVLIKKKGKSKWHKVNFFNDISNVV